MAGRIGGLSHVRAADDDARHAAAAVRHDAEIRAGAPFKHYEPLQYATQVVAGVNFFIKVDVGDDHYIHLRVYRDLSQHYQLSGVQTGKKKTDELHYFQ